MRMKLKMKMKMKMKEKGKEEEENASKHIISGLLVLLQRRQKSSCSQY